jgi:hypothetical protein
MAGFVAVVISVVRIVAVPLIVYTVIRKLIKRFRFGENRLRYSAFNGKRGRKLGATEALLDYAQERFGFMVNVNVVFIGCREEISPDQARASIEKLCRRHPVLRCRTIKGPSKKIMDRFLVEDGQYFPKFEVIEDTEWKETFHNELRTKFQEDDGLWRVKMFQPTRVTNDDDNQEKLVYPFIFTFNHCSIDGASIMAGVNKNFLSYLEQELSNCAVDVESLPLLDTRENIFRELHIGPMNFCWLLYDMFFGKSDFTEMDPIVDSLHDVIRPENAEKATKLLTFTLDENESRKLISKCKELNVKVNGFMTAAVAMATRELLSRHHLIDERKDVTFRSAFMVNLRRFATGRPIPDEVLGKLNSMVSMEIEAPPINNRSPKAFANLAERFHTTVHSKINNNDHFRDTKKLDFAAAHFGERLSQVLLEMPGKGHLFYITNRGAFHLRASDEDNPKCSFEGTYWATAEHMVGMSLFTHSLCSVNGRVFWSMAYSSHMVHQTLAEEYIANVKEVILEMSGDRQC